METKSTLYLSPHPLRKKVRQSDPIFSLILFSGLFRSDKTTASSAAVTLFPSDFHFQYPIQELGIFFQILVRKKYSKSHLGRCISVGSLVNSWENLITENEHAHTGFHTADSVSKLTR